MFMCGMTITLMAMQYTVTATSIELENEEIKIFNHHIRTQRSVKSHNDNNQHSFRRHGVEQPEDSVPKCPPPMRRLPKDICIVDPCLSDSECTLPGHKCCYNGCMNTCVHVVRPPPLIDWETRRSDSDNTYKSDSDEDFFEYRGNLEFNVIPGNLLVESHRSGFIGEICSTTELDGEMPMECPHGYECYIEDQGNPSEGIPDHGRCIAINENAPEDVPINDYVYRYF